MVNAILKRCVVLNLIVFFSCLSYANNIQVTNVTLTDQNTTDHFAFVEFDISWENSWRVVGGPGNWDAAWVFVKYRIGAGPWLQAWINDSGHIAPIESTVEVGLLDPGASFNNMTNPGMGVFIYRSGPGSGTIALTDIKLRWNYGDNGLSDNEQVDIKVFAIEHVFVPQGAFYLGSGGSEPGGFFIVDGMGNPPYQVQNESAINVGGASDELYYNNESGTCGDQDGPIPAIFPKGYNAFYIMKYELSQQGYCDFLNTLTRGQQQANINASLNSGNYFALANSTTPSPFYRNAVRFETGLNYSGPESAAEFFCDLNNNNLPGNPGDGRDLPCSYLKWSFIASYLDWAGLRPITELEYEKAARGNLYPVPNEYAWGSFFLSPRKGYINQGTAEELPSNPSANAATEYYDNTQFYYSIRCGAFATPGADRVKAGAGYFGAMELSGNQSEVVITVGSTQGRSFDGRHGNGLLLNTGYADIENWPDNTNPLGAGIRGGSAADIFAARTSDRNLAAFIYPFAQLSYGVRGGRTVPN